MGVADNEANMGRLTEREREILAYVAAHHRSKAIARKLGTAPKTVDTQISNACRKLGVANRNEAVRLLLESQGRHGMGDNPSWAPSPIAADPGSLSTHPVATRGDHGDLHTSRDAARGAAARHDLWRSGDGSGADIGERDPSDHGAISGVGLAPTGALSDGSAGDVRNPSLGQLPGGHSDPLPRFLTQKDGWLRLAVALAGSFALAVALPLGLKGVLWLQQLVHSLH